MGIKTKNIDLYYIEVYVNEDAKLVSQVRYLPNAKLIKGKYLKHKDMRNPTTMCYHAPIGCIYIKELGLLRSSGLAKIPWCIGKAYITEKEDIQIYITELSRHIPSGIFSMMKQLKIIKENPNWLRCLYLLQGNNDQITYKPFENSYIDGEYIYLNGESGTEQKIHFMDLECIKNTYNKDMVWVYSIKPEQKSHYENELKKHFF